MRSAAPDHEQSLGGYSPTSAAQHQTKLAVDDGFEACYRTIEGQTWDAARGCGTGSD